MPKGDRSGVKSYAPAIAASVARHLQDLVDREGGQGPAGRRIGISQENVSRVISGAQQLQIGPLIELRRELGIPLDGILGLSSFTERDRETLAEGKREATRHRGKLDGSAVREQHPAPENARGRSAGAVAKRRVALRKPGA